MDVLGSKASWAALTSRFISPRLDGVEPERALFDGALLAGAG